MIELAAAAIGALIGALAVYRLDLQRQIQERAQAAADAATYRSELRRSIATVLLMECRAIEHVMRSVFERDDAALWRGAPPTLMTEVLRPHLIVLSPDAMVAVHRLLGYVHDFYSPMTGIDKPVFEAFDAHHHWHARIKAALVVGAIPAAVDALLADGGVIQWGKSVVTHEFPDLPELPLPRLSASVH